MTVIRNARRVGAVLLLASTTLLGGCFLAEDDDTNPIITNAQLAYPIKMGPGRQCIPDSEKEACERTLSEKLPGGGYRLSVWSFDEDGKENDEPGVNEYKLRLLKGPGIPAATFLVQSVHDNAEQRYLGLLRRRPEGGWVKVSPHCDKLSPTMFVDFMNNRWFHTGDHGQLSDVKCYIRRQGLDDLRLYTILNAVEPDDSAPVLFDGG